MASDSRKKAVAKYDAANTKQVKFKLNLKTDADILAKLDAVDNKQAYFKQLIRNDIRNNQPVMKKRIVKGTFSEGEEVVVEIDGREFKRKVYYSHKWGDLVIIVYGNEYAKYEFEGN